MIRESRSPDALPASEPGAPSIDRETAAPGLRLAIGKEGLGIELARPISIGCCEVTELVVRLPHVRFPFDVTGGVGKFRHKRGELDRLVLEIDGRRLARFAETKVRGLLAAGACEVSIEARRQAFGVTISARHTSSYVEHTGSYVNQLPVVLVFDVLLVAQRESVSLLVTAARGSRLPAPATTLAIRAASAILGDVARREGSRFSIDRAATRIARAMLPEAGVRAPEGDDIVLAGAGESDGVATLIFTRGAEIGNFSAEAIAASEVLALARESDDLRVSGNDGAARSRDVALLETAPRHPDLARRIAEIDAHAGGRAEAALALLRETRQANAEADAGGMLFAMLLAETGDAGGAIAAFVREGERERSPALGAIAYAEAAALDPHDALRWLDGAVGRMARMPELRWTRGAARIRAGRLADARADFQELEAMASGPRARFAVLRRAGDVYRDAGLGSEAAVFYERALLYKPDDPSTLAGLGASLAAEGRAARGAALLAHAIEATPSPANAWMSLVLARVLGDQLGDKPAAIARLRAITDEADEAIDARGLEARFRVAIGDPSGASLAFARLRERSTDSRAIPWLIEAATFETERGELRAAQRHLDIALGLAPRDEEIGRRYRAIGERLAEMHGVRPSVSRVGLEDETRLDSAGVDANKLVELLASTAPPPAPVRELDEAEAELRVEELTQRLQGDPTNDAVADELVIHLTRLNRGMELLALLSARLEDAPPDKRESLLPRHREALANLESKAREEGRPDEADLFKMAREST